MDHLPFPPLRDGASAAASCHLVAVPYPGRGHVNPMMCLCRLLAARGTLITFVVTEEWLALLEASPGPPPPPGVRLRTVPNVIPSKFGRAANFSGFLEAVFTRMGGPFELLLDELERRPDAIVTDFYLPWAVDAGNRRGIPVASLFTMSASYFSVMYHLDRIPARLLSPAVDDNVTGLPYYYFYCKFLSTVNSIQQNIALTSRLGISDYNDECCTCLGQNTLGPSSLQRLDLEI